MHGSWDAARRLALQTAAMTAPEIVRRVEAHGERPAVRAIDGTRTYAQLFDQSHRAASALLDNVTDLDEARVAFMVQPSAAYVATMFGAWRAGAIAVPIGTASADPEIEYVLDDASPAVVVADDTYVARLEPLAQSHGVRFVHADALLAHDAGALPNVEDARASMMLYTSGTTGRPKGVVHTHTSIAAQIDAMIDAWAWTEDDRILCTLPLHHVHGIVNVLLTTLWSGAQCEILPAFDAGAVWQRIAGDELTLFMAVPTIYLRLIQAYEQAGAAEQDAWRRGAAALRLMVSGSAALPVSTLERWHEITGHTLLERYGMTEIGMALTNTLTDRRPGHVGVPMPGVEVRLVDETGATVPDGEQGEIFVRGANVFREYWQRPDATRETFAGDWFRTGDVAVDDDGSYRILGRASVDIIKSGGEKISALEVEDVLRAHPQIVDCAVVGVPDPEWGERVCAVVVAPSSEAVGDLRAWAKERLAAYKVPRQFVVVDELPRNAMGKVVKPELAQLF
jgi:malonyl-CoA/methylmalonyl-CoA synthetase